ncbi:unnamed protein product [Zymoseptoria tritici ST99CH_1A5]|uniref:Protein kinase domain-containing protein n=1 Tax=Zymoseptoria tritici ST99CH_1A5 TaxID=1276529 RepID=A0A1Y6LWY9_ZYMTR|nr:unnamed protein product [Zymoseptoria tritici ST99CH_1A5]
MTSSYPHQQDHIASLIFESSAQPGIGEPYTLLGNREFDIGRHHVFEALNIDDRSISTHHLRFRCIIFGDTDEGYVPPMIYMTVLSNNAILLRRYGLDDPDGGITVSKGSPDVLLNSEDRIQLTQSISITLRSFLEQTEAAPLGRTREAEAALFANHFKLTRRILGIGAYASVRVAIKPDTGRQYACKIVRAPENNINGIPDKTSREYNVLKDLSHPNIVSLEKVFRTTYSSYIFQELITGGDLLSYLCMHDGCLEEPEAAMISKQLLEAVEYLHLHNVVHRDIKPENILMTSWRMGARVVLTDFGQSRSLADVERAAKHAGAFRMHTQVGTPGYTAPEVHLRMQKVIQDGCGYSKAIDIWSIGCVTAMMFHKVPESPEFCQYDPSDFEMSQTDDRFHTLDDPKTWGHISSKAKGFIKGCLAPREADRLTASEGLTHKWFTSLHHRSEFEAAYERAVADWKPRPNHTNIVEFIDTSHIQNEEAVRSHHFEPALPRPASEPRSTDQADMIARWRADEVHASPAAFVNYTASQYEEESLDLRRLSLQPPATAQPESASYPQIEDSQDEFRDAYIDHDMEFDLESQLYQASQNQAINRRALTTHGHY